MRRNKNQIEHRKELIHTALTDADKAAEQLECYANKLRASTRTTDRVAILSELLCVSEQTIFIDFANY